MEKILVVGPSWIGDMVMAQSLFKTLKIDKPDCVIDVLAPGWSLPILARMAEVDEGIALPVDHGKLALGVRRRVGRSLRGRYYDRALVLPRSLKAALVPWFAQAGIRTGYRGEFRYGLLNDIRPLDKKMLPRTVQRYVALGLPKDASLPPVTPFPSLQVDPSNQQRLLAQLGLSQDRPVVGFMPGAEYGPAKQWPIEYYGELAGRLAETGYQVWIFGSAKDSKDGERISSCAQGPVVNLAGRTELADVVDLLALCSTTACNDSGLMHVAAAVDLPLVAIYGSTTPGFTPPLSTRAEVCRLALSCSPCFERECPQGHLDCLKKITVDQVQAALQRSVAQ